jgi:hypothetical protein
MRCSKCGSEIRHVPEHLANLVAWVCQECSNTAPRRVALHMDEEMIQKRLATRGRRKAA